MASENKRLPYDIGADAYVKRKHFSENPHHVSEWMHDEWFLGWSQQRDSEPGTWDWESDDFIKMGLDVAENAVAV